MTRFTPLWAQAGTYAASEDRRLPGALWPLAASSGCAVGQSTGMVVAVQPGQVAVPTSNGSGTLLCSSDAAENVTITAAPPSGTNRIDLVVCQAHVADVDGGSVNDFQFMAVAGTPAATPSPPAVPANAVALAQVYVTGGAASIVNANITDRRPGALAVPGAAQLVPTSAHARIWRQAAITINNVGLVMAFDSQEAENTPGMVSGLNTVNARISALRAGRYLCCGALSVSGSVGSTHYASPRKNGTTQFANGSYPWITAQAQWGGGPFFAAPISLQPGDWVEMTYQSNTATAQNIQGGAIQTWMSLDYLGPL